MVFIIHVIWRSHEMHYGLLIPSFTFNTLENSLLSLSLSHLTPTPPPSLSHLLLLPPTPPITYDISITSKRSSPYPLLLPLLPLSSPLVPVALLVIIAHFPIKHRFIPLNIDSINTWTGSAVVKG